MKVERKKFVEHLGTNENVMKNKKKWVSTSDYDEVQRNQVTSWRIVHQAEDCATFNSLPYSRFSHVFFSILHLLVLIELETELKLIYNWKLWAHGKII